MSTRANLKVWDREFFLDCNGYPEYVLEEVMELRSGKKEALFACYENLEQGKGSFADYEYDFTDQDGEIVVIVSGETEDCNWSQCPSWEIIESSRKSVKLRFIRRVQEN